MTSQGSIYVVEFSHGVIKVGYATSGIRQRMAQYRHMAAVFNATVTRTWISPEHHSPKILETRLIDFCGKYGLPQVPTARGAKEYYRGVTFDEVVAFAKTPVPAPTSMSPVLAPVFVLTIERPEWETS